MGARGAAAGRAALALAVVAAGLAACGGERPQGVEVTEADDGLVVARAPRPAGAASDTVYADSGLYADPRLDSLRRDSLGRDSLAPAPAPPPPADAAPAGPDFRAFWPRFRAAVEAGPDRAAGLAAFSDRLPRDRWADTWARAFDGPFRPGVLALTARDFARDGEARRATVVVGYDADGAVVRQDEAVRESRLALRFEVVDGAYRLVSADVSGR